MALLIIHTYYTLNILNMYQAKYLKGSTLNLP